MAQNTMSLDEESAREFGHLHEIAGVARGDNSTSDREMDLKNNEWAINYVSNLEEGESLDFESFFNAFKEGVMNGDISINGESKPTDEQWSTLKESLQNDLQPKSDENKQ